MHRDRRALGPGRQKHQPEEERNDVRRIADSLKSVRETEQAVDVVHVGQTGIAYLDRQGMPAYTDFRRIASIRYDAQRKALKIAVSNIDRTLLVLHPSQNGALDGQYIVEQLATQIGEARECYATRGKAELTCQ